jgi:holin-like protein
MLYAGLALVALQCLGDLIAAAGSLPIPGMVIGLILLFCGLSVRGWWLGSQRAVPGALNRLAGSLHSHFGLLFVPAGVGVVANIDRLAMDGPALLAAVLISTAVTVAVTATIAAVRLRSADTVAAE